MKNCIIWVLKRKVGSSMFDPKDYLNNVPSKGTFAWAFYLVLAMIFSALYNDFGKEIILSFFFVLCMGLFFVQVVSNIINLIKDRPSFNQKKVMINILLVISSFILFYTLF